MGPTDILSYAMAACFFWWVYRDCQQMDEMKALLKRIDAILRKAERHD